MSPKSSPIRPLLGVGLISLSTLLLELLLTRIFSVSLFYHFAFMVISLALFGLGLAGVVLFLKPDRYPREKLTLLLARTSRLFAGSTVLSLLFVLNHSPSMSLDVAQSGAFTAQHFFQFLFLYSFASLPFFFGGMVISLALFHLRERVATLYFYDLAGASLACLLLDPLLRALGAPTAVLLAAALAALAAVVFGEEEDRFRPSRRSIVLAVALLLALPLNLWLDVARLGSVKLVNDQFLTFTKWNAISRVEVQNLPQLPPIMTIDALAATQIYSLKTKEKHSEAKGISALVHAVRTKGRVLIIGPGGGVDVLSAIQNGHRDIVLAEINPIILEDVMGDRFKEQSGNLFGQPGVHPHLADGRSFVRRSSERYDVIQATLVDTWAATGGGAFALTENHLYTVEAFVDYLTHLTPTGIVTMTRWADAQSMEFVRLGALARTALDRLGVEAPERHTFAASANRMGTLLVRRTPFTLDELRTLHLACRERGFLINYSPVGRYLNPLAIVLGKGDPNRFYATFPIDVRPVYDDRPFFFYTVKPELLLKELFSKGQLPLNSFSAVVLAALLGVVLLLVASGIVVPLALSRRVALAHRTGSKLHDLLFFLAIGAGFILVEIALMARFALYLGHPVHSLRVVLFSLLLSSSLGSLVSGRVREPKRLVLLLAGAGASVVLLVTLHALVFGRILDGTMGLPLYARMAIAAALVALPAFAMGMMLPTGIRLVSGRHAEIIPWAWGLNGAASVLGSVLAMVVGIHLGFRITLLVGAALYLLALAAGLRRPPEIEGAAGPGSENDRP